MTGEVCRAWGDRGRGWMCGGRHEGKPTYRYTCSFFSITLQLQHGKARALCCEKAFSSAIGCLVSFHPRAREPPCFRMRDWRWGVYSFKYATSAVVSILRTVICWRKHRYSSPGGQKLGSEKPRIRQKYSLAARYVENNRRMDMPCSRTPNNSLCDAVVNRWKMLLGYHMYSCCGATRCVAPG